MTKLRLLLGGLTVLAAFLVLTAAACGDGGEETGTPAASQVEDQLKQMVLQLEDLPSGVVRAEERFVTNEQSAAGSENQEERLANLEEWGRILGYDVTYQANPEVMSQVGLILVNSTATLYDSEEGITASFADAVQTARTTDWADFFGAAEGVEVDEIPNPGWVDEMLWLRITAKAAIGEEAQEETFANDIVLLRQGVARGSLMVGWVMGRGSSDLMEQLAETQARHLKDALP
jgi:hypothetical protein